MISVNCKLKVEQLSYDVCSYCLVIVVLYKMCKYYLNITKASGST